MPPLDGTGRPVRLYRIAYRWLARIELATSSLSRLRLVLCSLTYPYLPLCQQK